MAPSLVLPIQDRQVLAVWKKYTLNKISDILINVHTEQIDLET